MTTGQINGMILRLNLTWQLSAGRKTCQYNMYINGELS